MPRPRDNRLKRVQRTLLAAALIVCAGGAALRADEPLHERIDRLVESGQLMPLAAAASDAEFVRRASLDLIGRIPSAAETQAYLADTTPTKREALVDRLLASPEYCRQMANVFDVMLMERRPGKYVPVAEWHRYLYDSFVANKPYDVLVREILSVDGVDPATRPQSHFLLDREGEANLLTRDVGRIFLGVDLQCAQCHDHPLVADYYQADYQGLYAFFSRTILFTEKGKTEKENRFVLAEKADGDVNYQSVFDATRKGTALPKLPGGQPIAEPTFAKGQEYQVAPADNVRPVPKYSRRAQLAVPLTGEQNRAFSRNITNRLWAHLMGRGLVEPVDMHHDSNLPTQPAVLDLLTEQFPAMKYDIRALLRELALTRTYARAIDLPAELPQRAAETVAQVPPLEEARKQAVAVRDQLQDVALKIGKEFLAARKAAAPTVDQWTAAQAALAEAKKNADAAAAALAAAQTSLPGKQDAARVVGEASAKAQEAVQKLPEDKELADATAKIKARSDQLAGEAAALAKAVTDGQAAIQTTGAQVTAQEQAANTAEAAYAPVRTQLTAMAEQAKAADAKLREEIAIALAAEARLAEARSLAELHQSSSAIAASRAAAEQIAAALAAARTALTGFQPEMDRAAQGLSAAQQVVTEMSRAVEEARKPQLEKKAIVDAVNDALAKTQLAQQKLPDAAELAQAVQALKAKSDQLAAEIKPLDAQVAEREAAAKAAAERMAAAQQAAEAAAKQMAAMAEAVKAQEQAAAAAQQQGAAAVAAAATARQSVAEHASARCAVAALKHLTPEQLAWSMMQATGVVERERAAAEAEWTKNHPTPDDAAKAAHAREVDLAVETKLQGNVAAFVSLFAAGAGQPQQQFQATVDQALFLANGGQVRGWLAPADSNLTDRLVKQADPPAVAAELYQNVLSRPPSEAEVADVTAYLTSRAADKAAAVQELIWALFCSAEFRFNH